MQLGLSSFAYGWAVSANSTGPDALGESDAFGEHDLLDLALGMGLRLAQFGDHIPLVAFGSARLDLLRDRARDEGVALEIGGRTLSDENLAHHIALCERMGSRLLRFVIDGAGFEPPPDDVVATVRAQVRRLEGSGVTLGIENHDRFPCRVLRRIIEEVGSPNVGVCLDTANSLGAGEGLGEVLQVLAGLAVNLHLKDFSIARVPWLMGFTVEGRAAGEGMMDAPRVIAACSNSGRCLSAVVETWTPPEPSPEATLRKEREWARRSVEYLRALSCWGEEDA